LQDVEKQVSKMKLGYLTQQNINLSELSYDPKKSKIRMDMGVEEPWQPRSPQDPRWDAAARHFTAAS